MKQSILNHKLFTASDYSYLSGKGYSDKEILFIWDRDLAEQRGPVEHVKIPVSSILLKK